MVDEKTNKSSASDGVAAICVQVFAKITASVSHELKNVLAIINENGGLLDDLMLMAGPDQGVPPERIKAATGTIGRQVQRANIIIKNINRFAHLGDTPVREESVAEILGLMTALADRQAAMKNIKLTVDCPADLQITAPMQPLAALIYLTIRGIVEESPQGVELALSAAQLDNNTTLTFSHNAETDTLSERLQNSGLEAVLLHLDGSQSAGQGALRIMLPSS